MALAVVIGLRLATSHYSQLADLPGAMFDPPWFLTWLEKPPGAAILRAVQGIGIGATALSVVWPGARRGGLLVAWLALAFLGGVETSAGKILHNDVLVLLATIPFLVPPRSVTSPGVRDPGHIAGWHHRTAMAIVALGYLACGAMKLRHSGWAWITSDNLRWVLYSGARRIQTPWPQLGRFIADQAWLSTTLAAATIATELAFPLALVSRWLRPLLVAAVISLHVGVFLTLGLDYWTWVATVLILFVPWTAQLGGLSHKHVTERRGTVTSS